MDFILDSVFDDANNCWSVSVSGEIDIFNSADLKTKLIELINDKEADISVNCRSLEYIDSTALGSLVAVLKNVKSYNGQMKLVNVKPHLVRLFRITNLDKVFMIEGDKDE